MAPAGFDKAKGQIGRSRSIAKIILRIIYFHGYLFSFWSCPSIIRYNTTGPRKHNDKGVARPRVISALSWVCLENVNAELVVSTVDSNLLSF